MFELYKECRLSKLILFVSFTLYYVVRTLEYTNFSNLAIGNSFSLLKYASYGIALIGIVYKLYYSNLPLKRLLFRLVFYAFVMFMVVHWDQRTVFVVLLFSVLFNKEDIEDFLKLAFGIGVIVYFATILCALLDIIPDTVTTAEKYGILWERHSFGFVYPGQTMMSLVPLIMIDIYLHKQNRSRFIHSLFWFVIAIAVFSQSLTIMPTMVSILFLIFANLPKRIIRKFTQNRFVAFCCCGISMLLVGLKYVNFPLVNFIDSLLNYRLSLTITAINKFGITLLGTGFTNISNDTEYLYLDSDYSNMIISCGVIYLVLCLVAFTLCIIWAKNQNNLDLLLILNVIAINSIVNNGMFDLVMNPFIIVLFTAMREDKIYLGARKKWLVKSLMLS